MAGDGEHEVVVLGAHDLDVGAAAPARRRSARRPPPGRAVGRRQDAPAVVEELGKAGVGAGMLGAGDRMAGMKWTPAGRCGCTCAITAPFTEPTSETMAPGLRPGAICLGHRAAGADRHAEDDEIGVPHGLGRGSVVDLVGDAELAHPRAHRLASVDGDDRARRGCVAARRARSTSRSGRGRRGRCARRAAFSARTELSGMVRASMKSRERRDHEPVRLLGADGQAQGVRQAIGIDARAGSSPRARGSVGVAAPSCPRPAGNGSAGSCRRSASPPGPAPRSRAVSQGSHFSLCATAAAIWASSSIAAMPAAMAGP